MTVMLEHRPNASAAMYPLTGVTIIGAWASGVPRARAWTVETLTKWKMPHLADSAEYVVSELVTNAIKASQYTWQATVTVWLASDARELLIEVWDGSTEPPMPAAELLGEGGRGLVIVEALCHSWGFYPNCRRGKVVWALL